MLLPEASGSEQLQHIYMTSHMFHDCISPLAAPLHTPLTPDNSEGKHSRLLGLAICSMVLQVGMVSQGISQAASAHLHGIPHAHGRINSIILLNSLFDDSNGCLTEGPLVVSQQRVSQIGVKGRWLADGIQLVPAQGQAREESRLEDLRFSVCRA